jgi:FlaA1/EpsC-like NDP-sugar epimerase
LLASAIGAATVAAYITSQILIALAQVNYVIPRSAPFITFLLALAATAGPRLVVRVISRRLTRRAAPHAAAPGLRQRVAIMGAGDAGTMTARELQNNPQLGLDVAGYFDDDPAKRNVLIHGIPVLGSRDAIPTVVRTFDIRTIIIAMPTAPGRDIRQIVDICEAAGVATKIIPGIYELLDGTVSVNQLRDVDIEDLLRRDPIHTDIAAVHDLVRGRRVLVTGGGGSIGSELCRQLFRHRNPPSSSSSVTAKTPSSRSTRSSSSGVKKRASPSPPSSPTFASRSVSRRSFAPCAPSSSSTPRPTNTSP